MAKKVQARRQGSKGTPAWAWLMAGLLIGALAYFVMPFDAVPDLFLGLGFTDDAAVLLAAFTAARMHVTEAHRARARAWLRKQEAPLSASPAID